MADAVQKESGVADAARRNGCILLFGMPRSGTTWLGKLFDSHPDTLYRHEPDSVHRLNETLPLFTDTAITGAQRDAIRRYVAELPAVRAPKVCAKLPLFAKSYLSGPAFRAHQTNVALNKIADRMGLRLPIVTAAAGAERRGVRIVWKSIESLGRLGALLDSMPDARAIHLIRHPCGSIASVTRGENAGSFVSATRVSEDWSYYQLLLETGPARRRGLSLDDLKDASPAQRMAWRWVIVNEKAMDDAETGAQSLVVRYEDVCANPREQMTRLLGHCGLARHPQVDDFIERSTSAESNGYYSVFKNPKESADKWQRELDPAVIDEIMAIALQSRPGRLFKSCGT